LPRRHAGHFSGQCGLRVLEVLGGLRRNPWSFRGNPGEGNGGLCSFASGRPDHITPTLHLGGGLDRKERRESAERALVCAFKLLSLNLALPPTLEESWWIVCPGGRKCGWPSNQRAGRKQLPGYPNAQPGRGPGAGTASLTLLPTSWRQRRSDWARRQPAFADQGRVWPMSDGRTNAGRGSRWPGSRRRSESTAPLQSHLLDRGAGMAVRGCRLWAKRGEVVVAPSRPLHASASPRSLKAGSGSGASCRRQGKKIGRAAV